MFLSDIGAYRLLKLFTKGGFGAIYQGENRRTGYQVAIKLLHPHLDSDENVQRRFQQETTILQTIRHPHVVNIFDAGVLARLGSYLVMEWLEGETFAVYVAKQKGHRLSLSQAIPLFSQLLEGLAHLHQAKITHRDLKPSNLMLLQAQGHLTLKILDFGVAQSSLGESLTETGKTVGTPEFMAPEQFDRDFGEIGPQTDLYAAGLLLVWALTGRTAFSELSLQELMRQKLHGMTKTLAELGEASFPLALEGVIEKALQKQTHDRYPDALSMLEALRRVVPIIDLPHSPEEHAKRQQNTLSSTKIMNARQTPSTALSSQHLHPLQPTWASYPQAPTPTPSENTGTSLQPPGAGYHPRWYISRPKEEEMALAHLANPGTPVVLWGPKRQGKTWTLKHIANGLKSQGYRVAELSLKQFDEGSLASLDSLTRELALHLSDELETPTEWFEQAWKRPGNPLRKLTWFMGRKILPATDSPLVVVLDRVDALQKQSFSDDFFGMLRSWAEDAFRETWSRLRLFMAVSTTPTQLTERHNQSPFNLTPPIYLGDFGLGQLKQLALQHQLSWDETSLQSILHKVGGNPYLVRLLMYRAATHHEPLEDLLHPQHELYQPHPNQD